MDNAELKEYKLLNEIISETGLLLYEYNSATGRILWSGNTERVTGYSKSELSEFDIKMWIGNIHPDDVSEIENQQKIIVNGKRAFILKYRFQNKNGNYLMLQDSGVAFVDGEGKEFREIGRIEVIK